jgi:hypothetical protein
MGFSFSKKTQISSLKNKQIKKWVHQVFELDEEIPISLSQLRCIEPGCPPIETVINVLVSPVKMYKIHKQITDIEYSDICNLIEDK